MADGKFTNAILDENNVLVGYETVTDDLLHVRAEGRYPWPNNEPDLAPKRYRLMLNKDNGKELFVPIMHHLDDARENLKSSTALPADFVVRALLKLDAGEKLDEVDRQALKSYGSRGGKQ